MSESFAFGEGPPDAGALELSFAGLSVRLRGDCAPALAAVESALSPYCRRPAPAVARPAVARVALWRALPDTLRPRLEAVRSRSRGETVAIFRGRETATRFEDGGLVLVETHRGGTIAVFDRRRLEIAIVQPAANVLGEDAAAIVRGQVLMPWCAARVPVVHAATACVDGEALVLFGDSGDGKSSALAALLFSGTAAFMSNDRVLVSLGDDGPVASGLPYPLALGSGTAWRYRHVPGLAGELRHDGFSGKATLTSEQLERALAVPTVTDAPVGLLVRPLLNRRAGPCAAVPMTPRETRDELERNVAAFRRDLDARNWARFVGGSAASARADQPVLEALARTPCRRVYFSRSDDPRRVSRLLQQLVSRAKVVRSAAGPSRRRSDAVRRLGRAEPAVGVQPR